MLASNSAQFFFPLGEPVPHYLFGVTYCPGSLTLTAEETDAHSPVKAATTVDPVKTGRLSHPCSARKIIEG